MKTTTLLFLFCSVLTLSAQNFGVTFYATNSPEVLAGMPKFYPKIIESLGTNTVVVPPAVLMTGPQVQDCFMTNHIAYEAYSNQREMIRTNANIARIIQLFAQIPAARAQMTNIQTSTISSVAAASTAIKTSANVINGILEELQRLGPMLKDLYRPESDETP